MFGSMVCVVCGRNVKSSQKSTASPPHRTELRLLWKKRDFWSNSPRTRTESTENKIGPTSSSTTPRIPRGTKENSEGREEEGVLRQSRTEQRKATATQTNKNMKEVQLLNETTGKKAQKSTKHTTHNIRWLDQTRRMEGFFFLFVLICYCCFVP